MGLYNDGKTNGLTERTPENVCRDVAAPTVVQGTGVGNMAEMKRNELQQQGRSLKKAAVTHGLTDHIPDSEAAVKAVPAAVQEGEKVGAA